MNSVVLDNIQRIAALVVKSTALYKADDTQGILVAMNEIRDQAWAVKNTIFSMRLLDMKITSKADLKRGELRLKGHDLSAALDDLMDLL